MNMLIKQIIKFLITSVLLTAIQNLLASEAKKRLVPKAEGMLKGIVSKLSRRKKKNPSSEDLKPLTKFERGNLKNNDIIDMDK